MEMILDAKTLPSPILRLIHTKKVKMRTIQGEILITPIRDEGSGCPFLGMFADGKISTEKFMAQKQIEKEMEA